ncbi:hypothetical protein LOAG_11429 [Loa loa]|uniref:Uncharacterized protein n=1 Tax=Loa loa TaxID=7209 RepID=A0A1S0TN21_LOALO|nr:hypothetical protein LOAG_11429 [Loa loa]EFO17074.1 hypothetical protein LOAG_11429 [Loa loa]
MAMFYTICTCSRSKRNMLKSTTLEDKSVTGDEFTTDNEVAIVKKSQSNSMSPSNVRRLPVGITHNRSKQSGKEAKSQDEKTSDNRTNNLSLDTSSMYGITDTSEMLSDFYTSVMENKIVTVISFCSTNSSLSKFQKFKKSITPVIKTFTFGCGYLRDYQKDV